VIRIDFEAWPELYEIRLKIKLYEHLPYNKELIRPLKHFLNRGLNEGYNDLADVHFTTIIDIYDDFKSQIEEFYVFLFKTLPKRKFILFKTKREKELIHLFKVKREKINSRERLKIAEELGQSICKRYFNQKEKNINNLESFINFYGATMSRSLFKEFDEQYTLWTERANDEYLIEINGLSNKLKRNVLSEGGLELYNEIINEIAKIELIGHKPNLQRVCNDIAVKKNLTTDLRKSFDQWRRRNSDKYEKLLNKAKKVSRK